MSRVYWSSKERTEELHGSERAWLDLVCTRIGAAPLDDGIGFLRNGVIAKVMHLLPPGDYLHAMYQAAIDQDGRDYTRLDKDFYDSYRRHVMSGSFLNNFVLGPDKTPVPFTNVFLNTAIALGSNPVALAARIHGSCELFGFIEGLDRNWVADIIDEGISRGIYRTTHPRAVEHSQGWEKIQELLRERDDGPVVMSYSVSDSFPNMNLADWHPAYEGALGIFCPEDWEAIDPKERDEYAADFLWAELPFSEQWDLSIAGLRKHRWWARIGPDTINHLYRPELTSYDLVALDSEERITQALAKMMAEIVTPEGRNVHKL